MDALDALCTLLSARFGLGIPPPAPSPDTQQLLARGTPARDGPGGASESHSRCCVPSLIFGRRSLWLPTGRRTQGASSTFSPRRVMEPGPSAPWLSFQHWLAQHKGSWTPSHDSGSETDSVRGDQEALSEHEPGVASRTGPPVRPTDALPRASVPDCRLETRMVNEYACARQQMTVMLAAPGVPAHKAPLVTAKQVRHRVDGGCVAHSAGAGSRPHGMPVDPT